MAGSQSISSGRLNYAEAIDATENQKTPSGKADSEFVHFTELFSELVSELFRTD